MSEADITSGIGNQSMSVLNDPFNKNAIEKIRVSFSKGWVTGKWEATGNVEFKNGNTSGNQTFRGENFDEVVRQIKIFIENLD